MPLLRFLRGPARAWWVAALASGAALSVALVCCWLVLDGPRDVMRSDGPGAPRSVTFPYSDPSASTTEPMELTFHIRRSFLTSRSFVIVPDDRFLSLSVNGREQSLSGVPAAKLDD